MTMSRDQKGPEQGTEEEHGIRPVTEDDPDIKAVIDEAVDAVEAVTRRREDEDLDTGNGQPGGSVDGLPGEVSHLRDRLLRTLADFDNYRKRAEREKADDRKYATVDLLRDILGVVDNLERALAAEGGLDDLKLGVDMTLRQMEDLLRRAGVEGVESVEREFDPSVHEAVSRVEDPEVDTPRVIEEMQRGYTIYDRLLRPAIVRVAVPAPDAVADDDHGDEASGASELDSDDERATT